MSVGIKPDKEFLEITVLMLSDDADVRYEGFRQMYTYAAKMDYDNVQIKHMWKRAFREVKGLPAANQIELFEHAQGGPQ